MEYNSGNNRESNSNICCLIFIGRLDVRFDLSDYKQLLIGQVKSDSFGAASAKLSNKIGAVKNQSDSSILLLTQLVIFTVSSNCLGNR